MSLTRLRWMVLGLLCMSTVVNYLDRQALSVVLPALRKDLGLSSVDYGTITTLFLLAYTVAQVFGGMWIDRVGTRIGFVVSVAVWSVAAVAHAFVRGPGGLGALRVLLGLGEAGNWPAGTKAISEWFPKSRRAFAMGVFDGGSAAGAIIAPPMVALLAVRFGWRAAFVVTGMLGFAWLAGWLWIYRQPAKHPWLSARDQRKALAELENAGVNRNSTFLQSLGRMLSVRQLWGIMVTRMIATPVWWFYIFWLPDYLSKARGFSLVEIGLYGWIPFLTVDVGKLLGGGASDRLLAKGVSPTIARKSVMAAGAIAMLAGIPVVEAGSAAAAIAWVCLATFGFGMWSANILALHADVFPSSAMATAVGFTGTAASLGGAIFTYVTGWLVDSHGYSPVFWTAGLLALFALVSLIFLVGRVEMRHEIQ